jgi:hypothetical protein
MSTGDRPWPEPLHTQLRRHAESDRQRLARLATRGAAPAIGDVYAVDLPLPSPDTICVTELAAADVATLVACDARPFFCREDLWLATESGELCLRRSAKAQVAVAHLHAECRVDHFPTVVAGLVAADPIPPVSVQVFDPDEHAWRAQIDRSMRLLPRWLGQRILALELADLQATTVAQGRQQQSPQQRAILPRLAAAAGGAREHFERAAAARKLGVRWEEIDCPGGRLVLWVSLDRAGLTFEPEADSSPPPILWISGSGATAADWVFDAELGSHRCAWLHAIEQSPLRLRVATPRPFHIEVHNAGFWS